MESMAGTLKILLADDDDMVRRLVRAALKQSGHQVDVCRDGREATDRLGETAYDLLVLDVMMPHRTGVEIAEELRSRGEQTPVVIISSSLSDEIRERCEKAGRVVCLAKPVDAAALEAGIAEVLGRS